MDDQMNAEQNAADLNKNVLPDVQVVDTQSAAKCADLMTQKVRRNVLDDVQLNNLAVVIANASPPPNKMKVADALIALTPQIHDAVERGHTADSLADLLQSQGIHMTKRSVAHLLRKCRTDASQSARRRAPKKPAI